MAAVTQIDLRLQKKPRKIHIVGSYSDKEKIKSKSLCSSESQVKQPGDHPAGIVLLYQDYATQKMGKENHSIADLPLVCSCAFGNFTKSFQKCWLSFIPKAWHTGFLLTLLDMGKKDNFICLHVPNQEPSLMFNIISAFCLFFGRGHWTQIPSF